MSKILGKKVKSHSIYDAWIGILVMFRALIGCMFVTINQITTHFVLAKS